MTTESKRQQALNEYDYGRISYDDLRTKLKMFAITIACRGPEPDIEDQLRQELTREAC